MKIKSINNQICPPFLRLPEKTQKSQTLSPYIQDYVSDSHIGYSLNKSLRSFKTLSKGEYKTMKDLDSLFYTSSSQITSPTKVYRGISFATLNRDDVLFSEFKDLIEGKTYFKTYTDRGFASTTTDFEVAKRFAGRNGVVLEINLPAGVEYIDIEKVFKNSNIKDDFASKEHEFLLPRDSKFLVTAPLNRNGIVKVEYLEEVFPKTEPRVDYDKY